MLDFIYLEGKPQVISQRQLGGLKPWIVRLLLFHELLLFIIRDTRLHLEETRQL